MRKAQGSVYVDETGQKGIRETPDGTVVTFVASDGSEDRDQEKILSTGWVVPKGTVNVLFDHDYLIEKVVGKIVGSVERSGQFLLDVLFADKVPENNLARFAVGMLRAGFLGPVSVGFIPLEWDEPDGKRYTRENPSAWRGTNPGRTYVKQELLELSMVAVGSNRNAMQLALRAFGLAPADAEPAAAPSPTPVAEGVEPEATATPEPVPQTSCIRCMAKIALPDPGDDWLLDLLKHDDGRTSASADLSRAEEGQENAGEGWLNAFLASSKRD